MRPGSHLDFSNRGQCLFIVLQGARLALSSKLSRATFLIGCLPALCCVSLWWPLPLVVLHLILQSASWTPVTYPPPNPPPSPSPTPPLIPFTCVADHTTILRRGWPLNSIGWFIYRQIFFQPKVYWKYSIQGMRNPHIWRVFCILWVLSFLYTWLCPDFGTLGGPRTNPLRIIYWGMTVMAF